MNRFRLDYFLFLGVNKLEEISNNIQEARRIFERLESETRRLALVCLEF